MTDDFSSVDGFDEAFHDAEQSTSNIIDRVVTRLSDRANARAVFGEPVERNGVTVIPVASVRYGFGGGEGGSTGSDDKGSSEGGSGAGGGMMASPAGYIEIRDGRAQFFGTRDPASVWPLIIAGGAAAWLVLRGFRAIVHG